MKKLALAAAVFAMNAMSAMASDLPAPSSSTKRPIVNPIYTWTGFYVGVNAGGSWGRSDPTTSVAFSPVGYFTAANLALVNAAGLQSTQPRGFSGGFGAGYNWQVGGAVLGIEGDLDTFRIKGSAAGSGVFPLNAPVGFTLTSSVGADWLATIRGRVGFAADKWLFFATGGAAVTSLKGTFGYTDNCFVFPTCGAGGGPLTLEALSFSNTKLGFAVGAGVETALFSNWSVKAEYLFVNFGSVSGASLISTSNAILSGSNNNPFTHRFDLTANIVRLGVNYKFGAPLAATY